MKRPGARSDRIRAPKPAPRAKAAWRQSKGGKAHRQGHASEWIAAAWLMAKGYQILGFRLKSRAGEIDILARRGRILAVVEVKRRATLDAALESGRLTVCLDVMCLDPGDVPENTTFTVVAQTDATAAGTAQSFVTRLVHP